ncbi:MAG: hypothetical protein ABIR36_14410 [Nitrospiraceae bacterium]
MKMERVIVRVLPETKTLLDSLGSEGYTASMYLRHLVEVDMQARLDSGWIPGEGWPDDPEPKRPPTRSSRPLLRKVL